MNLKRARNKAFFGVARCEKRSKNLNWSLHCAHGVVWESHGARKQGLCRCCPPERIRLRPRKEKYIHHT